ncbi:hypothetical protein [Peribacillus sp. SCS-155]|uniref:hypothetical protein n=1 Tax=Peribacillus sedimenti TaxID=3115297 RepID=UPI0039058474
MEQELLESLKLLQEENKKLTKQVKQLETLLKNISVPIIPSILPDTILFPFAGELSAIRFNLIIPQILNHANKADIDSAIVDFTAMSINEINDLNILGHYLQNLTASLHLLGVQVLVFGFTPEFARELVISKLSFINEINTFSNFRNAPEYLMQKKGIAFTKVNKTKKISLPIIFLISSKCRPW